MNLLEDKLLETKNSRAYHVYLELRGRILSMMDEMVTRGEIASSYWTEELAGFEYMLDASPLIIDKLREHCYHITGLLSYHYRNHHRRNKTSLEQLFKALQSQDKSGLFVPESAQLGGFGYDIDGKLMNVDTLKFYECLLGMDKAGFLVPFKEQDKQVVLEIGAGWGGFAYQFKTLFPKTTYIIVDLPQTLLFSSVYLKSVFPRAQCLVYGERPTESLLDNCKEYDFIFLPHYFMPRVNTDIDMAVNMVSFQEMTTEQVEGYLRQLAHIKCPRVYTLNRDRSPNNEELSAITAILDKYYSYREIDIVRSVSAVAEAGLKSLLWNIMRGIKKMVVKPKVRSIFEYRHLACTPKV